MSSRAGLDVSEKRILAPASIRTADRPASKFVTITTTLSRILYPEDGSNIFLRNLRIYVQVGYRCFGTTCRFTSSRVKTSISNDQCTPSENVIYTAAEPWYHAVSTALPILSQVSHRCHCNYYSLKVIPCEQTDRHDEANSRFSQFTNAPKIQAYRVFKIKFLNCEFLGFAIHIVLMVVHLCKLLQLSLAWQLELWRWRPTLQKSGYLLRNGF